MNPRFAPGLGESPATPARPSAIPVSGFGRATVVLGDDGRTGAAAPRRGAPPLRVAVVGGGVTGAAVAYHLARTPETVVAPVTVFEPRPLLGAGLAYGTDDPTHRINVPASKMSLLPDDEGHFARWIADTDALADDREAILSDGRAFPRRALFGRYVAASVAPLLANGRIAHVRARVVAVRPAAGGGWSVESSDGTVVDADIVVLAATHPAPAVPRGLEGLRGHPRFVADATVPDALAPIRPRDRVLIVGTGLTMADIVASLAAGGHVGPVTAISRRGLLPRGHADRPVEPFGDFTSAPSDTARRLLREVRGTITAATNLGLPWQPVIDAVRAQGDAVWAALPLAERRRLVRHLRPYWDVHRFRIAPQLERLLRRLREAGRLEITAASVASAVPAGVGDEAPIEVALAARGGGRKVLAVDAVVLATGPAHGAALAAQPFLAELAAAGLLAADPTGLGIACDRRSRALDAGDRPVETLLVAGPLARGTFGELMGLPQVTDHAAAVAAEILAAADVHDRGRPEPAAR